MNVCPMCEKGETRPVVYCDLFPMWRDSEVEFLVDGMEGNECLLCKEVTIEPEQYSRNDKRIESARQKYVKEKRGG